MRDTGSGVILPVPKTIEDQAAVVNEAGCEHRCKRVHSALRELQPEAKEVFLLRMNSGLAYEEIARIWGCPVERVKMQMRVAVHELRKVLKKR